MRSCMAFTLMMAVDDKNRNGNRIIIVRRGGGGKGQEAHEITCI